MVAILVRVLIYTVSYMCSSCVLFPVGEGGGGSEVNITWKRACLFVCSMYMYPLR